MSEPTADDREKAEAALEVAIAEWVRKYGWDSELSEPMPAWQGGFREGYLAALLGKPVVSRKAPTTRDDGETVDLEIAFNKHQPVLSMRDGHIAGCICMDRVFYREHEWWGSHLLSVASGVFEARESVQAVDPEPWLNMATGDRYSNDGRVGFRRFDPRPEYSQNPVDYGLEPRS